MMSDQPAILPPTTDKDLLSQRFAAAGMSIRGFEGATTKHGSLVQALIRGREVEMYAHYPDEDVRDGEAGAQYFYHSHRTEQSEHGHMHLFWHADSRGRRTRRPSHGTKSDWAPTHLFAIGFDDRGLPVSFFTTNWWVTDGYWFDAATALKMVDRFVLRERGKYASVNRFLNGLLRLYRPVIAQLLLERDRRVTHLTRRRAWHKVRNDTRQEVLSHFTIDWLADIERLDQDQRDPP